MSDIWDRNYELKVYSSGGNEKIFKPPMQVEFNINNQMDNTLATARITVYGVSEKTRKEIYDKYDKISLKAGYGESIKSIFSGTIFNKEVGKNGVSTYIRFYCATLTESIDKKYVSKSWGEKTPAISVITDVAKSFDIDYEIIGLFDDLPTASKGKSLWMYSRDALDQLSRIYDFNWSIDARGILVIRRKGAARDGVTHDISAFGGMEGIPRFYIDHVEVDIRMRPAIQTYDCVNVYSKYRSLNYDDMYFHNNKIISDELTKNTKYIVRAVHHKGNFWRDDWTTTIVAYLENASV